MKFSNQRAWSAARNFRFGRRQPKMEAFVEGNRVELRRAGRDCYQRMLACIEQASSSVWMEMYWFSGDELGMLFFEALARAARRGVDVRVIYDSLGSYGTANERFLQLRAAGAQVEEFNPVRPLERRFHLAKLTLRDHRKLLIVDGRIAFTGGTNIAREWLPVAEGGAGWRDEVAEVTGPVVKNLCAVFAVTFRETTGEGVEAAPNAVPAAGDAAVAVLTQGTFPRRRLALSAYLWRIAAARRSVYLSSAYFIPEGRLARALVRAAKRGIDVRVMCPGRSDVAVVSLASRHTWEKLLAAGVRIFEWNVSVFHSKTGVVDGEWTTVGSFNLDRISLRNNRELNVSVLSCEFAQLAETQFLTDCELCQEVNYSAFRSRPWQQRLIEWGAYLFRAWL